MAGAKDDGSGSSTDNSCPSEGGDGESGSDMDQGNLSQASSEDWTPPQKGSGNKKGKKPLKGKKKVNSTWNPRRPW